MKGFYLLLISFLSISTHYAIAQDQKLGNELIDSIYISDLEKNHSSPKVLHAEPLFIDLIRDLGARKGEKEWNVGMGLIDKVAFDEYTALVEYEWAPINRLGLEVELPFSFYYPTKDNTTKKSQLNSLKLASQYSFYISERYKTSLAVGYIHEFELAPLSNDNNQPFYKGNIFNPFFVAAKRWGNNFHTLIYTGPNISHHRTDNEIEYTWNFNTNFHYMISGTRNFIGVEFNKYFSQGDFDMTIRPQMRLGIADNLLVGIVTGIPISREQQRFSTFIRLIYEPHSKK